MMTEAKLRMVAEVLINGNRKDRRLIFGADGEPRLIEVAEGEKPPKVSVDLPHLAGITLAQALQYANGYLDSLDRLFYFG